MQIIHKHVGVCALNEYYNKIQKTVGTLAGHAGSMGTAIAKTHTVSLLLVASSTKQIHVTKKCCRLLGCSIKAKALAWLTRQGERM